MNCNTFYSMDAYQTTANVLANAKLGMNRQQWIATLATELLLLCLVKVEKQKQRCSIPLRQASLWGFPCDSVVKNTPIMQETWVSSLGWEDPLEKEVALYSNILAWRIPWTEELGELQSMGSQRVRQD